MRCAWYRDGGLSVSGGRLAVTYEGRLTQSSSGAEDVLRDRAKTEILAAKCRQKRSGSPVRTF